MDSPPEKSIATTKGKNTPISCRIYTMFVFSERDVKGLALPSHPHFSQQNSPIKIKPVPPLKYMKST
jgi:hypothetical protein